MSVGYPTDKATIDARVGGAVIALRNQLQDMQRIKQWLDTKTVADLKAIGYTDGTNGTVDEIGILKSAFTDFDNLAKIATAQGTQSLANNFFYWGNKLVAFN